MRWKDKINEDMRGADLDRGIWGRRKEVGNADLT